MHSVFHRTVFIKSVMEMIEQNNFDGLSLDFQYPGDATRGSHVDDKALFASMCEVW